MDEPGDEPRRGRPDEPRPSAPSPTPTPPAQRPTAPTQTSTGQAPAPAAPTPPPTAARLAAAASAGHDPASFGTADLRNVWPQVLEAVKVRRRVTWIALQQNTQVHELAGGVLTLSVNNPGVRDSLQRAGSEDVIREAVLEVVGIAPRIAVVYAETGAPEGSQRPGPAQARTASPHGESAAQGSRRGGPAADASASQASQANQGGEWGEGTPSSPTSPGRADQAKQNIRGLQFGARDEPAEEPDRDDANLDEVAGSADELLTKVLGAELIGEEEPGG